MKCINDLFNPLCALTRVPDFAIISEKCGQICMSSLCQFIVYCVISLFKYTALYGSSKYWDILYAMTLKGIYDTFVAGVFYYCLKSVASSPVKL